MRTDALGTCRWRELFFGRAWVWLALLLLSAPATAAAQQKSAGTPGAEEEFPRTVDDANPGAAVTPDLASALGVPPNLGGGAPGGGAFGGFNVPDLTKRENISAALQLILLLTILSLAPDTALQKAEVDRKSVV